MLNGGSVHKAVPRGSGSAAAGETQHAAGELEHAVARWFVIVLSAIAAVLAPLFLFLLGNVPASIAALLALFNGVISNILIRRGKGTLGSALFFSVFIIIISLVANPALAPAGEYSAVLVSVVGLLLVVIFPTGVVVHPWYPVAAVVVSGGVTGFFVAQSTDPALVARIPVFSFVMLFGGGVSLVVGLVTRSLVRGTRAANEHSSISLNRLHGIIESMNELQAPLKKTRSETQRNLDEIEDIVVSYSVTVKEIRNGASSMQTRVRNSQQKLSRLISAMDDVKARMAGQETSMRDTRSARGRLQQSLEQTAGVIDATRQTAEQLQTASENGEADLSRIVDHIAVLQKHQDRLLEVNEVIHDISDQTHLLAINAAIEAANAGAAGRGFAVVADKIGELARNANQRSSEIGSLIEGMQQAVKGATNGGERTRNSYARIRQSIHDVQEHIQVIDDRTHEFMDFGERLEGELQSVTDTTGHIAGISSETRDILGEYEESFSELTSKLNELAGRIEELSQHNQHGSETLKRLMTVRTRSTSVDQEVADLIDKSLHLGVSEVGSGG